MNVSGKQTGFTLIEVVIVFAISGLLIAGVMVNRGVVRDQATKTATIDKVKNQLEKLRIEANTSVAAGNGTSNRTSFGVLVEFDRSTPDRYRTWNLVAVDDDQAARLSRCEEREIMIPDNVRYNPPPGTPGGRQAIVFVRKSDTQPDQVYTAPSPYTSINPVELTPAGCTSLPPAENPPLNYGCSPSGTPPSTCPAPVVVTPPTPPIIASNVLDGRNYNATGGFYAPITIVLEMNGAVGQGFITVTPASNGITRRIE